MVELLVSIAIFLIFTSVTLFNYPRFSNRVSLDLLAHNIALTVRQAQTFALGVRSFGGAFPAYGVHFEEGQKLFTLFADVCGLGGVPEGVYNPALCSPPEPDKEFFERFTIPSGTNVIQTLCVNEPDVDPLDPLASPGCGKTTLDISFRSPRPDAKIVANGGASTYVDAEIIVVNGRGDAQAILIGKSGQISIK